MGGDGAVREWIGAVLQDVRIAVRGLTKAKAFTVIAVLSLALGIGLNTAMFTYLRAALLAPVPGVSGTEHVVEILVENNGRAMTEWAVADLAAVDAAATPLEALAGWKSRAGSLETDGGAQRIRLMYVSSEYFPVLGVQPAEGRFFLPDENVGAGEHAVAVVSHAMCRDRLGADPRIVGSTVTINRTLYTVVGVTHEGFTDHLRLGGGTDIWLPATQHPYSIREAESVVTRGAQWINVLGRLRPGASIEEANAALEAVFMRLAAEDPIESVERRARAVAYGPIPALGRAESLLATGLVMALVATVLVIICGNLAGMVLARGATRERELSVRLALGSGRARLVRFLLVEALCLAAIGGGLGMLLASWSTKVLAGMLASTLPGVVIAPDGAILAFSLALTVATSVSFGLLPALRFSRPELVSSLKADSGGGGRRVGLVHRIAASAQTGLAFLLLALCSLYLRSASLVDQKDPGFEPEGLMVAAFDLTDEGYASVETGGPFLDRVLEAVGTLPGVTSAAVANGFPRDQSGNYVGISRSDADGERGSGVTVEFTRVTEGYFSTAGMDVLRGRGLERSDDAGSQGVVVIEQPLADRLWPGEDALGRQAFVTIDRTGPKSLTIVGITADVAASHAHNDPPQIYLPLRQAYWPNLMVLVRTSGESASFVSPIQQAIQRTDPRIPTPTVQTAASIVARATEGNRFAGVLTALLGALAVLLSAIGVYGVVSFAVTSRTREIGLRMAMGATRETVLGDIVRDAMTLALPGLALGALAAFGIAAAISSTLFGLSPADPVSFALAGLLLATVVVLASIVPARRASRVEPAEALRS